MGAEAGVFLRWRPRTRLDAAYGCFLCVAVVYGALGTPTPEQMGAAEWTIAALLLCAFALSQPGSLWWGSPFDFSRLFLLFGLCVPMIAALMSGNEMRAIVRDVIPFLFLVMPALYGRLLQERGQNILVWVLLIIGFLFALRCQIPGTILAPFLAAAGPLDYLANMPSVLLSAIVLAGWAIMQACAGRGARAWVKVPLLLGGSLFCLWPVLETLQRASTGFYVLSMVCIWIFCCVRSPKRALLVAMLGAGAALAAMQIFAAPFERMLEKNMLVGSNMRLAELAAVWQEISQTPLILVFGLGWGAEYASPAVAGITVNYTHSLLSALLLKTGVLGVALGVLYLGGIVRRLIDRFSYAPVLVVGVLAPLVIDVFLYASYKSLDFGLVLMLAGAIGSGVASKPRVVYQKI
jgi:hypothetical protein